jgi:hypothetical protein
LLYILDSSFLKKDFVKNRSASPTDRIYHKKLPRGWFTHIFTYGHYLPDPNELAPFWFFIFLGLYVPGVWRSYLKTSPQGIKLYYWPGRQIVASWYEVTHLECKKIRGIIARDRLFLNRPLYENQIVIPLTQKSKEWLDKQKIFIPLSDFKGWPDGELANDLRRYAPHVFLSSEKE